MLLIGWPSIVGTAMGRPPWRYSPRDAELHLIRSEMDGRTETLCAQQVLSSELEEPGDEDQPRCPRCIRTYGAGVSAWGRGAA